MPKDSLKNNAKNKKKNIVNENKKSFEKLNFELKTERIEKAYEYLTSLPCSYRKYENCKSYIHSIRVALQMKTESLIIVALLHDTLEDFGEDKKLDLEKFCTTSEVKAIEILTKKKKESYNFYIKKVKKNELSKVVKIYDILDNLPTATPENKLKYQNTLFFLVS